jgi:hypothetical protein
MPTTLVEAWDAEIATLAEDWSHMTVGLRLADPERMEEAALLACSLNPWHGASWRSGTLEFRVAHHSGYGASVLLCRGVLRRLDAAGIAGTITVAGVMDAVAPVATQGPTF